VYRIGYLGPRGTFSEQAARLYLDGREGESEACDSLEQVLSKVASGELDEGVVPVENSSEGAVGVTLDLLALHYDLAVRFELVLPVSHCLMAKPGVKMNQVEAVLSHPQALAQCRSFLQRKLPGVGQIECPSTVAAAGRVAGEERPWVAMAPLAAAAEYGLEVLVPEANDYPGSVTRFWVVGREPLSSPGAGAKTSIVFGIKDRPGALYHILGEFARRGLNLTRIESRPAKKRLGDYLFFIDFMGPTCRREVQDALEGVGFRTLFLKVLGSYQSIDNK
jgi:prephenate dehydratase